jgi:hypothetical protein
MQSAAIRASAGCTHRAASAYRSFDHNLLAKRARHVLGA